MTFDNNDLTKEKNKLLEKYPQLKKTQEEYDEIMSKTREEDKIQVALILLGAKVEELNKAIDALKEKAQNEMSKGKL